MIEGIKKVRNEKEYRSVLLDSSSSLKIFSQDRRKYFRVFIEGTKDDIDEDTKASITGRVVETLLLEPELFDTRFYLSACMSSPTGLMEVFVESLYRFTREATDDQGNIKRSFEDISRDAYIASGFKITYEQVIKKFSGSDAEIYYDEIRKVRSNNLTVVTSKDVTNAEKIVDELRTNPVTKEIINLIPSTRWDVRNQFQVEGYKVDDHMFKSMMDFVHIDHQEKTVQVYDLKTVWAVEEFYREYYLYRRSYIQAYLYWKAMLSLTEDKDGSLYKYQVYPPKFIVCDSINYYNPLIYTLDYSDLEDAYKGFDHKGKYYPGVRDIIKDLQWAFQNNTWNISRQNSLSNGVINIKG